MVMFIHDILMYTKTRDQHITYLRTVLQTLTHVTSIMCQIKEVWFWLGEVVILGHRASKERIKVDP